MTRSKIASVILSTLLLVVCLQSAATPIQTHSQYLQPGQSCTVFYGSDGNAVLGGNNEDFINPLTYVWFVPAERGNHGQVYFGFDDGIPQGAVNDAGLFYDGLALEYKAIKGSNKPIPLTRFQGLIEEIFSTASTVEQVMEIFSRYNLGGLETSQLLFGDRYGHSVIIDGDTVIPMEGKFQVATNFRLEDLAQQPPSFDRFDKATRMLSAADQFSVDLFRDVLDATHQEGVTPTQYSQVYDLKNNRIYLYHFHDFQQVVVLNITEELAKGPHGSAIAALFSKNTDREDFAYMPLQQHRVNNETQARLGSSPDTWSEFVGEYRNTTDPKDAPTRIYLDAGKLYAQKTGRPSSLLFTTGKDAFSHQYFLNGEVLNFQFTRNKQGEVTGANAELSYPVLNLALPYRLEKIHAGQSPVLWVGVIVVGLLLAIVSMAILKNRRHRLQAELP